MKQRLSLISLGFFKKQDFVCRKLNICSIGVFALRCLNLSFCFYFFENSSSEGAKQIGFYIFSDAKSFSCFIDIDEEFLNAFLYNVFVRNDANSVMCQEVIIIRKFLVLFSSLEI